MGFFPLSENFSLPSLIACCIRSLKRKHCEVLWPKKLWYLQKPLFFLCSNGGILRLGGTINWPSLTSRSKISSYLVISKVYIFLGNLSFLSFSTGSFPLEGINTLHT